MGLLRSCSRLPAIAVMVAAGLVVAACGSGSNDSNTSSSSTAATSGTSTNMSATTTYAPGKATVIGKSTDIAVSPAMSAALKQVGITLTAVAPARGNAALRLPVSGGQVVVSTLAGTVDHTGGLAFSHRGKGVTLTNFVIKTKTKHLNAILGRRSMRIFDLNLASPKRGSGRHGTIVESIKLTVTPHAATALNSGLGVSTFKAGQNFGIATLTLSYARGHR